MSTKSTGCKQAVSQKYLVIYSGSPQKKITNAEGKELFAEEVQSLKL